MAIAIVTLVAACTQDGAEMADSLQNATELANPASTNCLNKGGRLVIETAGDGGQYGVCVFDDNRQCEEWALLRGECPGHGIKVTGYVTPAARYCSIRGGSYVVMTEQSADQTERGTCRLPSGETCDARAYFVGKCS